MDNKQQAQERADQIQAFSEEVRLLRAGEILQLDEEQYAAIRRYHDKLLTALTKKYDIDTSSRQKQLSAGMKIASFSGALALAASVFFFFYQFWGYLSTPAQVSILIGAPLLSLYVTHRVAQKEVTGYFAKLLAMLSFACFVLNLVMLGQIFNVTPSENAFLVLAVFGMLLAYSYDVRLLLGLGIVCFAGFVAARTATWTGLFWLSFGNRPENFFMPGLMVFTAPLWLSVQSYSGFAPIYRVLGCLFLLVPILVLSNWGDGSYLYWDRNIIEGVYQLLGFAISAGLVALGLRKGWSDVINTGNIFFVLFLYSKMFDWWWELMPKYLFFLLIALSSILLLFAYKRMRIQGQPVRTAHA